MDDDAEVTARKSLEKLQHALKSCKSDPEKAAYEEEIRHLTTDLLKARKARLLKTFSIGSSQSLTKASVDSVPSSSSRPPGSTKQRLVKPKEAFDAKDIWGFDPHHLTTFNSDEGKKRELRGDTPKFDNYMSDDILALARIHDRRRNRSKSTSKATSAVGSKKRKNPSSDVDVRARTKRSMEIPIPHGNRGRQLLKRMGFVSGSGLGARGQGMRRPIQINMDRMPRGGLGSSREVEVSAVVPRNAQVRQEAHAKKQSPPVDGKADEAALARSAFIQRMRRRAEQAGKLQDFDDR